MKQDISVYEYYSSWKICITVDNNDITCNLSFEVLLVSIYICVFFYTYDLNGINTIKAADEKSSDIIYLRALGYIIYVSKYRKQWYVRSAK